jgi:hypothetical protein
MATHVEKSTMVLHEDVNENGLTTTLTNLEHGLNFVIKKKFSQISSMTQIHKHCRNSCNSFPLNERIQT